MRLLHERQGRGWEPGQLKARLQALIDKHAGVAKRPVFLYDGPPIGPVAAEVTHCCGRRWASFLEGRADHGWLGKLCCCLHVSARIRFVII